MNVWLFIIGCALAGAYGFFRGFREGEDVWRPLYHAVWKRLRELEDGKDPGPRVRRLK